MIINNKNIIPKPVEEEITQSYIDYAMSVIISRALPDVRDWLKPVQRRILYAMYELKLFHNAKYKKSAAVVWEVLGKYHPHGDSSVYEALVRMAQPFSLRYPLIDWQWNFWSIDWDWAAAQRYTEAKLTKLAEEMLADIDQDTVDWRDNYDQSRKEPVVLPTKFPNLLCNWTMWIAVWMATNMPPHNLTEIIDALLLLIEKPQASIDEIMNIIKWPDFPTWWIIFDPENIKKVYAKGKWSIIVRWKTHIEYKKWQPIIVIDEIPYQVNKANLVSKIWELAAQKKIEWIVDITDESSKDKIRVTITLKKWTNPDHVLLLLYKYTDLQTKFNVNNVVLTEWWLQPKLLNIKDLLLEFLNFRREVVLRRSRYQLNKAKERLHILEWLKKAVDILDDVIATIRSSETRQEAKEKLMNNFWFTEAQAEYILMLRLQTLVWLEILKILDEIKEKKSLIEYLTKIINDPKQLDKVIVDELIYIKEEYWDERRTQIIDDPSIYKLDSEFSKIKKLADEKEEEVLLRIWINNDIRILYQSKINVLPEDTFQLIKTTNQDKLLAITNDGKILLKRLKDIPSHTIKSNPLDVKTHFKLKWNIVFISNLHSIWKYILLLTNKWNIKKINKDIIESLKKTPTKLMNLGKDEKIIKVASINDNEIIWILSAKWQLLLFEENQIRASGKWSWGVKSINLSQDDKVVDMFVRNKKDPFLLVYSMNWAKLVNFEDLKIQKRWQTWLKIAKLKQSEELKWAFPVSEWEIKYCTPSWKTNKIHLKNIKLKNRDTVLDKITDEKIEKIWK